MDPLNTMKILKEFTKMGEFSHVTTFHCIRDIRGVGIKDVTIEVHDRGPKAFEGTRYFCIATTEDGVQATGNNADSIETAIEIVHWGDLDKKE